jgi:hypothetical protein
VLINANGQLGTARGTTRKPGAAASADRELSDLRAKLRRLAREVRALRAQAGG